MLILIAALFTCLASVSPTSAQTSVQAPARGDRQHEAPLELTRITSPILVDGVMNDEAWRGVAPLPLTMYLPVFRGEPTQRSEIRVAYDEHYFYAGGWFYDSDPKAIRINSLYRDRWNGDDALAIYIDAFNDNQNAKWFGVTAAGMRFDQLVSDDGNTLNDNWDGFWDAKTTITDEGWFVEVGIPFSTIGFQVDDEGRAVMGLTITRLVSRIAERVTFPAIDPKFPFRRPSSARDVMLRGVTGAKPFYLTPYVLVGGADTPFTKTNIDREIGVDARYPFSPNLTLDLTANTDFAQVEADEQQVALDRFPLFFPERRRFFQENAGLFDFVTAGGGRLFHSRRIGLTPDLQPVRIVGGARLVGRAGAWEVGALNMQTDAADTLPGENFGVVRLRRNVLNPSSTAGVMATTYYGGGRRNVAFGADTSLRLWGDDYIGVKWAETAGGRTGTRESGSLADSSIFDVTWERRVQRGLSYSGQLTRAGEDYRPELGFMPRRNFMTANIVSNYYVFTDKNRFFRRVYPGILASTTWRNTDHEIESGQYALWAQWDEKAGGGGSVEATSFRESVITPFKIGGSVNIPGRTYEFADLHLAYAMPAGRKLRTNIDVRAGTYFDGHRQHVILSPTWNVSRHLELGAGYQMTRLRFGVRDEKADIHLLRFRIRTALDVRASANAFIQYNSTTDRLDLNVRLRYNVREGTDLWIVYNEGLDTERAPSRFDLPADPLSLSRALIVKYSHTFTF
jgi:hypothetical protein